MKKMVKMVLDNPIKHCHEVILQQDELAKFLKELMKNNEVFFGSLEISYLQHNKEYMLRFETRGL